MEPNRDPQIDKLIAAVRPNKVLYDYRQPYYNDAEYTQFIWEEVAKKCDMKSAEDAKKLWNKLHFFFMNCYRNELIRLVRGHYNEATVGPLPEEKDPNNATGEAYTDDGCTWTYYRDMRFVALFRDKNSDPELEHLIKLAKPLVTCVGPARLALKMINNDNASANTSANSSTGTAPKDTTPPITNDETDSRTVPDTEIVLVSPADNNEKTPQTIKDLETFDIPPIKVEELSPQELSLYSFFETLYLSTRALPSRFQRNLKNEFLQSLHNVQALVGTSSRFNGMLE